MIRDAEHFSTKMSKIEGSGDLGQYIVDLVKNKPLPEKEALPAPLAEPVKEPEPATETLFDASNPGTPSPAEPTSPADNEPQTTAEAEKQDDQAEKEEKVQEKTEDPPLPPTPEQMEEAERKKRDSASGSGSGKSSPSAASEEVKLNGIEEAKEAMSKELPPTPMEVDGKEKKLEAMQIGGEEEGNGET